MLTPVEKVAELLPSRQVSFRMCRQDEDIF
jgi:hypothetical protein